MGVASNFVALDAKMRCSETPPPRKITRVVNMELEIKKVDVIFSDENVHCDAETGIVGTEATVDGIPVCCQMTSEFQIELIRHFEQSGKFSEIREESIQLADRLFLRKLSAEANDDKEKRLLPLRKATWRIFLDNYRTLTKRLIAKTFSRAVHRWQRCRF